ncbi:MAG: tagatose 1,6-diphosphate aldolase, partial [Spirochaetales bacterium]|nr:tagatose 1,6-diphosphate aldolase [Spirochaetales bacterium]
DWSVRKIKSFGASAIKLLVYYNPAVEKLADELETFVSAVIEEAHEEDITIFLEPLSYSVEASVGKESASFAEKRPWIVVETAKRLSALGPDVLKMEFPVDIAEKYTVREWSAHCEELSEACSVPWVLLSAGVDFDQFVRQLEVAVKSGASGYLAGRAIWKEAVAMEPQERTAFLTGTATRRAERLNEIVDRHAVPWTDFYTYPSTDEQWYTAYRNG